MPDIFHEFEAIANDLDASGHFDQASAIDAVLVGVAALKQAHNETGTLYWVRNQRCWGNCYRQKREDKPSLSAQEVWMECWDEYQKADEKWDKYAASVGLVKSASVQGHFDTAMQEKIASGDHVGQAIFDSIEDAASHPVIVIAESVGSLAKVAEQVTDSALSGRITALAELLVKEAQQWGYEPTQQPKPGMMGQVGQGIKNLWNRNFNNPKYQTDQYNNMRQTTMQQVQNILSQYPPETLQQLATGRASTAVMNSFTPIMQQMQAAARKAGFDPSVERQFSDRNSFWHAFVTPAAQGLIARHGESPEQVRQRERSEQRADKRDGRAFNLKKRRMQNQQDMRMQGGKYDGENRLEQSRGDSQAFIERTRADGANTIEGTKGLNQSNALMQQGINQVDQVREQGRANVNQIVEQGKQQQQMTGLQNQHAKDMSQQQHSQQSEMERQKARTQRKQQAMQALQQHVSKMDPHMGAAMQQSLDPRTGQIDPVKLMEIMQGQAAAQAVSPSKGSAAANAPAPNGQVQSQPQTQRIGKPPAQNGQASLFPKP